MSESKKLLKCYERARNATEKHAAAEDLAEFFLARGEFYESLKYYMAELDAASQLQDEGKIAKAHRMIGEVKLELSEWDEALKHTKIYYDYARQEVNRNVEEQRALTTLGRTYFVKAANMPSKDSEECKRVYTLARDCLWKSLKVCEKLEKEKALSEMEISDMRARSLLNLGLTCEGLGMLNEAEDQLKTAIRLCQLKKIDNLLRQCYISLGSLLLREKKFADALKHIRNAYQLCLLLPEKEQAAEAMEVLVLESEGHVGLGDIHSARRVLQKAYKLQTKVKPCLVTSSVTNRLKTVAAIDIALRKMLNNPKMPPEEKYKNYEELGDGFSSLNIFSSALEYYEKMLEHGKIADLNLKPCYVSLAQTCKDLKQYDKAILYLKQELQFCSSPKDTCYSFLSIQECEELLKAPVSEQLQTLKAALSEAVKAKDIKLEKKVLVELVKVQSAAGNQNDAEDTKQKLLNLGECSSDSEEETETDALTPCIGDYIDLDELSDSSDHEEDGLSDEESTLKAAPIQKRNLNRAKQTVKWRNEKGETKLHLACMNGNIKGVRTLLEQGSDVNAVDNAGWTPLHEACNHGFIDVVDLLINYGANINHRGGPGAGGITPLHDAGQAGNFEVMEFLLDKNASVLMLTDEGDSALDALEAFYQRGHNTLTPEEKEQYRCVKARLKNCLEKVGLAEKSKRSYEEINDQSQTTRRNRPKLSLNQTSPNNCTGSLRRCVDVDENTSQFQKKRSMREVSPILSLGSPACKSSEDDESDNEGQEGVSEYRNVMQNLRKNTETHINLEPTWKKSTQPLLFENEVVEDWLEDDVRKQPSKKRRKSDQSTCVSGSSYKPLSVKKKSASRLSLNSCSSSRPPSACSSDAREDQRLSAGSRNSDVMDTSMRLSDRDVEMQIEMSDDFDNSWFNPPPSDSWSSNMHFTNVRQSSLLAYGVTRQHGSPIPVPSQVAPVSQVPTPSCVNVQVEDRRLAIFANDPSLTIGWLAKEAAQRYKKLDGCLPVLAIYSVDGALYSDEDPVQMVLGGDVIGRVQSWNDSSITERYTEACQSLSCESDAKILSLLEASQATHSLDIVDLVLPTHILKPVFRAISMERNLSRINLSNNSLLDRGVSDLCENLGKLCNIKELDLSGNNISALGVCEIAKAAEKGYLKVLVTLSLSHNNLGDASLPHLITLTACVPQLLSLSLSDCFFTKSIWDNSDNQFLTLNKLQTLDLSHNQLHAKGLAGFLGFADHHQERRLNPGQLQNLYLIGLGGERLCQEVLLFLEHGNTIALRELHLSYSLMQDDELVQLISILRSASELHTLRLPSARNISAETICKILTQQPSLKQLEIHNSKATWTNIVEYDVAAAVNHVATNALERLTLRNAPRAVCDAWFAGKGSGSTLRKGSIGLQVFGTQSSTP